MHPIGHPIVRLEEVQSTNSLVLERPDYLEQAGLVLLARHQVGGRGRMGRAWASVPGSQLQFSVVLHPHLPQAELPVISLLAGLAVSRAVEERLAVKPVLKWPNDVLLGGRKVCGILTESRTGPGGAPRIVVGIGVNCTGSPEDFPEAMRPVLTTLAQESGAPVDQERLLQAILARLHELLERLESGLRKGSKAQLLAEWARRAGIAGRRVIIPTPNAPVEAISQGLSPEGFLVAEDVTGLRHTVISGDVKWMD